MSVKRFPVTEAIPERATYQYAVDLTAEDGTPVLAGQVDTILLSLRDVATDEIINGREATPVKNVNGGTLTDDGHFVFQFEEDDNPILSGAPTERRTLLVDVRLVGGGRAPHEVHYSVRNLRDVTTTSP